MNSNREEARFALARVMPTENSGAWRPSLIPALVVAGAIFLNLSPALAESAAAWDFTKGTHGWIGNPRVAGLATTTEGLAFRTTGQDPWIEGPALDLPPDRVLRLTIRMRSTADSGGEVFFGKHFEPLNAERFLVRPDGQWHDYQVVLPAGVAGPTTRFRLDPAHGTGAITVASIRIAALSPSVQPLLDKPAAMAPAVSAAVRVTSGPLALLHGGRTWGDYRLSCDRQPMAVGHSAGKLGILLGAEVHWISLRDSAVEVRKQGQGCRTIATLRDPQGATWRLEETITPTEPEGSLRVEVQIVADADRQLLSAPWLTLFPGLESFGERKHQALLAGVEYLEDEPSSSQADVAGPRSVRRTPDPVKFTFPLMAIEHQGRYLGLTWKPGPLVAATFDSPDRIYGSGAHLFALSAPAVGSLRFENDYAAHSPLLILSNQPISMTAHLLAGRDGTVLGAVRHYVALHGGFPNAPEFEGGAQAAIGLLARGWLDSAIGRNGAYRHAIWEGYDTFQPSPEAAMFISWLGVQSKDVALSERLHARARETMSLLHTPDDPLAGTLSHCKVMAAPFLHGRVHEYVAARRDSAKARFSEFNAEGFRIYKPEKMDYGRTHHAKHANGYAASALLDILQAATLSGDPDLRAKALALLDTQIALYGHTVPRGAQTWEIPLHTPDILASAHLVKAFAAGYALTGKAAYLDQARYWGWSGVPFIYLHPPGEGRTGLYATTPVLGATSWTAPLWIGLPVQWCGLVYASALNDLSGIDPNGPWKHIARGITMAGLQMCWPATDPMRQGLLPDFFHLVAQMSDGPAINPGTVQASLPEAYNLGRLYELAPINSRGWIAHAPGSIRPSKLARSIQDPHAVFAVDGWANERYWILVAGVRAKPAEVTARNTSMGPDSIPQSAKWTYSSQDLILVVEAQGATEITIR